MAATTAVAAPRYVPDDPTLPKPWKGLVDGKTGYLYFWNPVTNVTQYEKPVAPSHVSSPKPSPSHVSSPKPSPGYANSSVQVQQTSQEEGKSDACRNDDDKYNGGSNGEKSLQSATDVNASNGGGVSGISNVPADTGSGLSVEAYRSRHEISVSTNMAATTAVAAPRYAPDDPTLPKPWKGLVDGKTGYLYFWNPVTNVTQYEKPVAPSHVSSPKPSPSHVSSPKPSPGYANSSVQVQQTSQEEGKSDACRNDDDKYNGGSNGEKSLQSATDVNASNGGGVSGISNVPADTGSGLSVEAYRSRHEISVSGDSVPPPFMTFQATGFPSEILKEATQAGFSAPTPIQAQSWPIAMQGRDIVAIAKTGSGKTLGYLLPGFSRLKSKNSNPQMGPTVLVLSPTRELATQIQAEAVKFGRSSRIACTCLYGGAPKGPQLRELERGVDIVVATPGRLNDILEMKKVSLRQVVYLVLDEADRMLDMGFEPQIRKIVSEVPTRRQTLMYTATWPKEVRRIAADLLSNPVQVNIGNADELVANKSITQYVEVLASMDKQRRLEQIIRSQEPGSKIIVFCATKKMCDLLARNLSRQFGAAAIHGDKTQIERDSVLSQFRSGRTPLLIATDVAARGLDVKDIRVVVNYDFPTGIEDYVHRIGRTGRAGATGVAYTFLSDQDSKHASDLVKILDGANQQVSQEVRDMASRGGGMARGRRQWSSGSGGDGGYGGRGDFSYGGRDRDSFRRSPSPVKQTSQDWNRQRSRSPERFDQAPAGKSFHQMMMEKSRS